VYVPGYRCGEGFDTSSVYAIYVDETEIRALWQDRGFVLLPRSSPKTNMLAFLSAPSVQDDYTLRVINSGAALVRELPGMSSRFCWNPDGDELAFCPVDSLNGLPNGEIWVLDVASGAKRQLPVRGYEIYWSRRTGDLLFKTGRQVKAFNTDTGVTHDTLFPSADLSQCEGYCLEDLDVELFVYALTGYDKEPKRIATIQSFAAEVPYWLGGSYLLVQGLDKDEDGQKRLKSYVFDASSSTIYRSDDNVVAADPEKGVFVVRNESIVRVNLSDLTKDPPNSPITTTPADELGGTVETPGEAP
jgi:hypothetical protein